MGQQQSSAALAARRRHARWVELAVAFLGFVLTVGSIGYMAYRGFSGNDAPADIVVEVERVVPAGPGYLAEIVVRNQGDSTGAGVKVEGELQEGGLTVETSEATFDFVPGGSERHGGLYFTRDPAGFTLTLRAHGVTDP